MENRDQNSSQEQDNASDLAVAFCDKLNEELKPLRVEVSILTTDINELEWTQAALSFRDSLQLVDGELFETFLKSQLQESTNTLIGGRNKVVYIIVGPNEEILTSAYEMICEMVAKAGYEVANKEVVMFNEQHLASFDREGPVFAPTGRKEMHIEILFPLQ